MPTGSPSAAGLQRVYERRLAPPHTAAPRLRARGLAYLLDVLSTCEMICQGGLGQGQDAHHRGIVCYQWRPSRRSPTSARQADQALRII
jgi:hypothetical protein